MDSLMFQQPVQSEPCDYVFCSEEGVDPHAGGIDSVNVRLLVNDEGILEDQRSERLQVNLLESDFSVELFRQAPDNFSCNIGLYLRKLYDQCCRK